MQSNAPKEKLKYTYIMINGIYIMNQKRYLRITVELWLVSWRQSSEYPSVNKKKEKKNLPSDPWYYKESFENSAENTVPLYKNMVYLPLKHECLLLFVLDRYWDTTVSFNSPHQIQ